jgi:hypothetical protein
MKSPGAKSSPMIPVPSSFKYDSAKPVYRFEVIKIGKNNNKRYIAIYEHGVLMYKVMPV